MQYKPLSSMLPYMKKEGEYVPCFVYLRVGEVIDGGKENDKALDLLLKIFGNNKFYIQNNGSFHEYNVSIWTMPARGYYYNKYQAKNHDYDKRLSLYKPLDDSDSYIDDYSVVYVPDELFEIYNRYDVPWMMLNSYTDRTPDKEKSDYFGIKKVTKDEIPDIIEAETTKAVKNWELSKKNYQESVEHTSQKTCSEDDEEEWSYASQMLILGGTKGTKH